MRNALEISRLSKRYVAGCGSCLASAGAIVDVDLTVAAGESVALVGPAGCGKTTLLLCAAGLLTPDSGVLSWFGNPHRVAALGRARLHYHRSSLSEPCPADESLVHLVDVGDVETAGLGGWISERREAGDAVVLALRELTLAPLLAERVVMLRAGRIVAHSPPRALVAEGGFVDHPLRHV